MHRLMVALAFAISGFGQTVAQVTNLDLQPEGNRIDATLTNVGRRAITEFFLDAFGIRNGVKVTCGGRGQDMIDGSDPMPGTQILVHLARHWLMPGGERKMDLYPGRNSRSVK